MKTSCLTLCFLLALALPFADAGTTAKPAAFDGLQTGPAQLVGGCPFSVATTAGSSGGNKRSFNSTMRCFRNGVPSTCAGKACPGNLSGGPWFFDVYDFDAEAADTCVSVAFNGGSCGNGYNVHPSAWCEHYPNNTPWPAGCNPSGQVTFLGDSGSSPAQNATVNWSFCVPGGSPWSILSTDNYTPNSAGCTYAFTLTCSTQTCSGAPTGCGSAPTPTPTGPTGPTPDLSLIEQKLDDIQVYIYDEQYFTDDSELEVIETKLDGLETKIDTLEVEPVLDVLIVKNVLDMLYQGMCPSYIYTPEAMGGFFELGAMGLQAMIDNAGVLGCVKAEDIAQAQCMLDAAMAAVASGDYDCGDICKTLIKVSKLVTDSSGSELKCDETAD
jgi:hypothetical protein